MRTVELLEEICAAAETLGYGIRHEWLGGGGGGACEFGGRKWLFIDLALNVEEQLDQVAESVKTDPSVHLLQLSEAAQRLLDLRRAA